MSISSELRKYVADNEAFYITPYAAKCLLGIADRIDAEHEREMAERDSERFNALMDARERGVNAVLKKPEGFGLTALPKDADGVPWYVGDKDEDGRTVTAIKLGLDGFWIRVGCIYKRAEKTRHYHAPTVEDVMVEFATDWESAQDGDDKKDERINIGAGMVPTYHATESVEEAKAVVEQCKTNTERLRAMLDERGVKWTSERVGGGVLFTFTKDGRTYSVLVRDRAGLEMWSQYLTPEQAIAATLDNDDIAAENAKLRKLLKHNGAIIEACTSEILDHIGVPYIVGPAGVAQALMEATAMLVHKRYDFDPPSFYKVNE